MKGPPLLTANAKVGFRPFEQNLAIPSLCSPAGADLPQTGCPGLSSITTHHAAACRGAATRIAASRHDTCSVPAADSTYRGRDRSVCALAAL